MQKATSHTKGHSRKHEAGRNSNTSGGIAVGPGLATFVIINGSAAGVPKERDTKHPTQRQILEGACWELDVQRGVAAPEGVSAPFAAAHCAQIRSAAGPGQILGQIPGRITGANHHRRAGSWPLACSATAEATSGVLLPKLRSRCLMGSFTIKLGVHFVASICCIIATRSAVCGLSDERSCMHMHSCLQSCWALSAQTHPSWLADSSGGRRIGHLGMVNISRFWRGVPHAGPP